MTFGLERWEAVRVTERINIGRRNEHAAIDQQHRPASAVCAVDAESAFFEEFFGVGPAA